MSAALTYKPASRLRIALAFASAVALHVSAVAVASRVSPAPLPDIWSEPFHNDISAELPPEPQPPEPEQTVVTLPAPPQTDDVIPDVAPMRPRNEQTKLTRSLVRRAPQLASHPTNMAAAKVAALSGPRPEYPYEARRQRAVGSGIARLTVDFASGNVLDVSMMRSTGNTVLDNATISAFRRWRFKPGTVSTVQTPITFTLAGVSY